MTESGIGKSFPKDAINDGGTLNSRGMKTGLGSQSRPDHAETPRSYTSVTESLGNYSDRTNHIFELGERVSYSTANNDGANPSSNESLYSLFWR